MSVDIDLELELSSVVHEHTGCYLYNAAVCILKYPTKCLEVLVDHVRMLISYNNKVKRRVCLTLKLAIYIILGTLPWLV